MPRKMKVMNCSLEAAAKIAGMPLVCGVDEAGRGPLAGPVTAAAVILKPGCNIAGIRDSKKLSPKQREILYDRITSEAGAWAIAAVEVPQIDRLNILQASLLAMKQAVEGLAVKPDMIYVDGNFRIPGIGEGIAQMAIKDGDALCVSIAAASILAKVSRDRRMFEYDEMYPGYGFGRHKGYGTAEHFECLRRLGPSPIHRRSFEPVRDLFSEDGME